MNLKTFRYHDEKKQQTQLARRRLAGRQAKGKRSTVTEKNSEKLSKQLQAEHKATKLKDAVDVTNMETEG